MILPIMLGSNDKMTPRFGVWFYDMRINYENIDQVFFPLLVMCSISRHCGADTAVQTLWCRHYGADTTFLT